MTTTKKKLKDDGSQQSLQDLQPGLQLLPLIMNNIPQAVFWKDRNLVYLGCNQAFAEDAGLPSPEAVIGKTDFDMPWKDQAERYRADDRLVLECGEPKLNYEEPQTTPDGSRIWLRTSKIPVREADKVVAVLGMYEDITELKRVETASIDEKQRFQTILETLRIPTIISRLSDGQVLYANPAIAQMNGVRLEDLSSIKTGSFYAHPTDQERIRQALRDRGYIDDFEVEFQRTDGSLYWALLSARIINYAGQSCVLSSFVDITARKQAEAALKRQEEFSQKQSSVFAELARSEAFYGGDLQAAFAGVTEAAANTLNVQRSSIWYYNEDRTEIRCMDLFEQGKGHSEGIVLSKADFPSYFKALEDEKVIAADNAHTDPATREFSASYLTPLGINSMLDAPIRLRGHVIGVICNEHVGPVRPWTMEEQSFARMVVDFVTVAVETQERKQAEAAVHESEERFRRFTEATYEGLVFHEQGKIIDANPAGLALFGLTENANFTGRNLLEFVLPQFHQLIVEKMQMHDVPAYEVQCIRADGSTFPVETTTRTYKAGDRTIRATSIRDITERKRAEDALKAHDEFSQKQAAVFAELTRSQSLYSGDVQAAFAEVTEAAAQTLNVQRASIWYYNNTHTEIRCMDLFEQGQGHSAGLVLTKADFPGYFKALEDEKVIPADNAHTHPATREFSASYLGPLGINSMLDAPIRLRGEVIGVICHEHVGPIRQWKTEEQNFARTIVDFITVAVETQERKRLEEEMQTAFERRGLQVQLSTRVSQSLAAAASLAELYERVVTEVKEQFGYYHTQIFRYDPAQEAVALVAGYGETGAKMVAAGHHLPMGAGLIGSAAASGETVLRPVLENDPDWQPNPLLPETKGEIAVPIKLGDTLLGVLDVQSSLSGALVADDQLLLEGLCGQIATAIESTRLRQEMAERLEEINRLYRAMSHEGWQTYRQQADIPSSFMFDQGGLKQVNEPVLAEDLYASIPLAVPGGEVIGTLAVADDPQRPITPEDEAFLQQVSEQVALALESARLFEQTQAALGSVQESQAALDEAMHIAKLANWEYDVNRDRFIFNDHFYSIFHTTAEQVGGYEISSAEYAGRFVHPDDRPMVGEEIGKALSSTDRHYNVLLEHRILFSDGGVGYISVNVHIERDEQGNITRYYGANQDITERKLAEEAIARRATELATVAQVSTTTSTMLDPDQLLQTVVDLTKERFGLYHAHIYTYDESWSTLLLAAGAGEIGRKLVAEQHALPLTIEQSLVARAARDRKAVVVNDVASEPGFLPNPLLPETRAEMAVPMTVGDKLLGVFDVQSNNEAGFSDEDANIYVTLAAQVGVALQNARLYVEQAALVTQLRELDRLKSSFLANMSHELRTPLNSILGFADVIIEELDGPLTENMSNDLRLIQKNGQHLLHLINDVLDMAKIEAGRMNLNPETFKAFEVLEEVTSITSTLASEKNLALFIEQTADQEVKVYADRTRLRQVMINLVNNAIKFTETGKISLNLASLAGARILITVKDTGIGIPPDKLDAIFQEFTQVDSSSTRKAGGTGLGLPISRRLVEMHGGRLWVESTGVPGEGSTFFVELPVEARITETVEKQAK